MFECVCCVVDVWCISSVWSRLWFGVLVMVVVCEEGKERGGTNLKQPSVTTV